MKIQIEDIPPETEVINTTKNEEFQHEESNEDEVSKLRKALENKERQYVSLLKDFHNLKKRIEKDSDTRIETEKGILIIKILEVLDNFERAIESIQDYGNNPILEGILSIYAQLVSILKEYGVQRIDSLGKGFDPKIHEAVGVLKTEDDKQNIVIDELQSGYIIGEKLLRPSKVQVAM
ncbi:MAG: nucleotide exchange factor GrpE [Thermodesulfobacteriota bacterium]|nr:nucleotide exchange factor GrpE [Thermodesulfobacteriota bacterium]